MAETFLNGKITLTSLAAPTPEDIEKLQGLSDTERRALLREAIERGARSPVSDVSIEEVLASVRERVRKMKER